MPPYGLLSPILVFKDDAALARVMIRGRAHASALARLGRRHSSAVRQHVSRRKHVLISAACPNLTRGLSGPALECMRKSAHLLKAEQPRNLGYMQFAVIKVTNRQIVPQLLKYLSEVQPIV